MTKISKKQILETALNLVSESRNQTHGDAFNQLSQTAELWSVYLGIPLCAEQVAICQVLMKISRSLHGELNMDDYYDMCGYAAIAGDCAQKIRAIVGDETQLSFNTVLKDEMRTWVKPQETQPWENPGHISVTSHREFIKEGKVFRQNLQTAANGQVYEDGEPYEVKCVDRPAQTPVSTMEKPIPRRAGMDGRGDATMICPSCGYINHFAKISLTPIDKTGHCAKCSTEGELVF